MTSPKLLKQSVKTMGYLSPLSDWLELEWVICCIYAFSQNVLLTNKYDDNHAQIQYDRRLFHSNWTNFWVITVKFVSFHWIHLVPHNSYCFIFSAIRSPPPPPPGLTICFVDMGRKKNEKQGKNNDEYMTRNNMTKDNGYWIGEKLCQQKNKKKEEKFCLEIDAFDRWWCSIGLTVAFDPKIHIQISRISAFNEYINKCFNVFGSYH